MGKYKIILHRNSYKITIADKFGLSRSAVYYALTFRRDSLKARRIQSYAMNFCPSTIIRVEK